jgi:hypothetical protein
MPSLVLAAIASAQLQYRLQVRESLRAMHGIHYRTPHALEPSSGHLQEDT